MKNSLLVLGACSFLLFSCNKSNKVEDSTVKNSDSITVNSTDTATVQSDSVHSESKIKTDSIVAVKKENFELIRSKKGASAINKSDLDKLSESLKAIAALYSGLGGSQCDGENCELTKALGLGKQGSQAQKDLVKKWFADDKAAKQLIDQDFYQAPNSSSNFSDFQYLTFEQDGDTVIVNYDLLVYSHGGTTHIKGPDKFVIKGNKIETINRNIWKDTK